MKKLLSGVLLLSTASSFAANCPNVTAVYNCTETINTEITHRFHRKGADAPTKEKGEKESYIVTFTSNNGEYSIKSNDDAEYPTVEYFIKVGINEDASFGANTITNTTCVSDKEIKEYTFLANDLGLENQSLTKKYESIRSMTKYTGVKFNKDNSEFQLYSTSQSLLTSRDSLSGQVDREGIVMDCKKI